MEYRNLTLTLLSATGLKKSRFTGKSNVYAVVFISGATGKDQKQRTTTDKTGDTDPTWNFPMKFVIDEAAGLSNRLTLVVKIKAEGMFGGKNLGEVHVPVKELLEGVKDIGKAVQIVSYQVRRSSGEPKGVLSFKYEFGEKFVGKQAEPVAAYPPRGVAYAYPNQQPAGYGYPNQQPAGYGYPNQQPAYGYYPPPPPPPPPVVQPQPRRSGMGFGTGLLGGALGGLLIGDMLSGGGCGGGGCGGGGCGGGGCGGGGCGGF